jgi:hypothetical protein
MSSSVATINEANGLARRSFGDIVDLLPDKDLKVSRRIKFDDKRKVGGEYEELIPLTYEHGFTAGGTAGAARTLNSAIVATSAPARLTPVSIHFRTMVTHDLLSATLAKGPMAYARYIDVMAKNSKRAFDRREEQRLIYGGLPLGNISATATDGGTTITFVISDATFAPGPWIGSRNMEIDAYNTATQLNTDAALTVTSFNPKTRTVVATGTAADVDRVVAATTSVQFYYRGYYGNDGTGLVGVASLASTSGSYLGIACGTYMDVWNATQVTWDNSTTTFTWGLLNSGMEEALGRGLTGDVIAEVSIEAWRDLCATMDSLRVLDSSYSAKKTDMGFEELTYHHVAGGKVTVEPSTFIKRGHVLVYADPSDPMNDIAMIGSTKPSAGIPSIQGEDIFTQVQGTNYIEMGMFARQALWAPCPRNFVLFAP